jgi:(R,R)-butanediol dehydrogenase/meso-butanediol dehydrogenase/diacetyl reductase
MLLKIPDHVSFEEAVLYDILGVPFRGIRQSRFAIGDNVVVMGAGAIGLSAILFLKMGGARHITVVEPSEERRKIALEFGADMVVDPMVEGNAFEKEIIDHYGGMGADIVFECAGNPAAINTAIALTRSGGQLILIGVGGEPVSIVTAAVVPREIEIKTSFVYTGDEVEKIFGLMAMGRLNAGAMLTDKISLDDVVGKGIDRLTRPGNDIKIVIAPNDF